MPRPEDFYARSGEPVRPKLRALSSFVASEWERLQVSGPGVRMHQEPGQGRAIIVDPESVAFVGAFAAALRSGRDASATVGRGLVNGILPTIGGVGIDGTDPATGRPHRKGVPLILISLTAGGAIEAARSWLALSVTVDPITAQPDPAAEDAVTVRHLVQLTRALPDDPLTGLWPIAEIEWDATSRRPVRLRQILYFDQRHLYIPARETRPARHEWGNGA